MEGPQATSGERAARISSVILFAASLVAWMIWGYFIVIGTAAAFDLEAGDALTAAMILDSFFLPVAFFFFLAISLLCLTSGKELSFWVKVIFVAPYFLALLCGLIIFVRLT